MKRNRFQVIFVVVLLSFIIFGVESQLEESHEEARPNYEYMQIFRSIPTLFEYLLDALEERPEILEKNDVTIFNRNIDPGQIEEEENSDNETKMDKRNADCDHTKAKDKHFNNVSKRDTSSTKDARKTTVAYEYGNSNVVIKDSDEIEGKTVITKRFANTDSTKDARKTTVAYEYGNSNVVIKDSDEIEGKTVITKRFANTDNFNNIGDKEELKRELLKREDRVNRKKRSVLFNLDDDTDDLYQSYGEMFLGFEHLFGLDLKPEDIEERILIAEKLLEEHNNKKDK